MLVWQYILISTIAGIISPIWLQILIVLVLYFYPVKVVGGIGGLIRGFQIINICTGFFLGDVICLFYTIIFN
jgi:hypothetical protein